jgi:hypothetical protein
MKSSNFIVNQHVRHTCPCIMVVIKWTGSLENCTLFSNPLKPKTYLIYCNMQACLRPLLSNGPSQQVNSGDAC